LRQTRAETSQVNQRYLKKAPSGTGYEGVHVHRSRDYQLPGGGYALNQQLPTVQLLTLPHAGHGSHHQHPEAVAATSRPYYEQRPHANESANVGLRIFTNDSNRVARAESPAFR
jgi:hypothetical protein